MNLLHGSLQSSLLMIRWKQTWKLCAPWNIYCTGVVMYGSMYSQSVKTSRASCETILVLAPKSFRDQLQYSKVGKANFYAEVTRSCHNICHYTSHTIWHTKRDQVQLTDYCYMPPSSPSALNAALQTATPSDTLLRKRKFHPGRLRKFHPSSESPKIPGLK